MKTVYQKLENRANLDLMKEPLAGVKFEQLLFPYKMMHKQATVTI